MRKAIWVTAGIAVVLVAALAGILAFDAPVQPPPLAAVSDPFAAVDFSDLPAVQTYPARDGTALGYRAYPGQGRQIAVLIHGSSDDGSGMHALAKALRDTGASVYVPVIRGHLGSGRRGDIDYIGQLEDDLADFIALLRRDHRDAGLSLIGFSSGGGFVLRAMAGRDEALFDRFILISPALPREAPTLRPAAGGWVSVAVPRIVVLTLLRRLGFDGFGGLPIIAFATSPKATNLTSVYSFRLAAAFGAPHDYLDAVARGRKPLALLVGGSDELFYPERFQPLFAPVRHDLRFTLVPGIGHIGMTVAPAGIAAVRATFEAMTRPG